MRQVDDAKAIATAAGKSYVVRAVTAIHGESDDYAYATGTQEFPLDGTDGTRKAITSYADGAPRVAARLRGRRQGDHRTDAAGAAPRLAVLGLERHRHERGRRSSSTRRTCARKGKVVDRDARATRSTGTRTAATTRTTASGSSASTSRKAYARIVARRAARGSRCVRRRSRSPGNVITAKFHVPVPPLVLDTQRVVDPGQLRLRGRRRGGRAARDHERRARRARHGDDHARAAPAGRRALRYAYTGDRRTRVPGRDAGRAATCATRTRRRRSTATSSSTGRVHFDVADRVAHPQDARADARSQGLTTNGRQALALKTRAQTRALRV